MFNRSFRGSLKGTLTPADMQSTTPTSSSRSRLSRFILLNGEILDTLPEANVVIGRWRSVVKSSYLSNNIGVILSNVPVRNR